MRRCPPPCQVPGIGTSTTSSPWTRQAAPSGGSTRRWCWALVEEADDDGNSKDGLLNQRVLRVHVDKPLGTSEMFGDAVGTATHEIDRAPAPSR